MKIKKDSPSNFCIININSTQNNTILTATNFLGKVISSRTKGILLKSKKGKKAVPQGALLAGESLGSFLREKGYTFSQVRIKGFGSGRENAVQGILSAGLQIREILDITKIPHNGCRPKKSRRI
tara:strand:+ start:745 stop:1116 length:372 start_codon:yes stop_codon:yes gene_type:complete